jgi:tRNA-splicing ligase RtcB
MAHVAQLELVQETPFRWRIEQHGEMRVAGRVFASSALLPNIATDEALRQVANVRRFPESLRPPMRCPMFIGAIGFAIGGVAATDVARGGVVSPGGVGFDISCGVRLLVSQLGDPDIAPRLSALMDSLSRRSRGMGKGAVWSLGSADELADLMRNGAGYAVAHGFGSDADLAKCEDGGAMPGAEPDAVSERACSRGLLQVGSLGSGNHFLEVQAVDTIYDPDAGNTFGLFPGQVCVMIHCGSRGLGQQSCSDFQGDGLGNGPLRHLGARWPARVCLRRVRRRAFLSGRYGVPRLGRVRRRDLRRPGRPPRR